MQETKIESWATGKCDKVKLILLCQLAENGDRCIAFEAISTFQCTIEAGNLPKWAKLTSNRLCLTFLGVELLS